jgi:hypothetical protein
MAARKLKKKEIIDELVKCGKDPLYFLNTYAKIEHPKKGAIPLHLFDYQKDIIPEKYHLV